MRKILLRPALLLVFVAWLGPIVAGYAWLLRYSFVSGQAPIAPESVPPFLAPGGAGPGASVALALHPRCPCSLATVRELSKILSGAMDAPEVTVLVYRPSDQPDGWLEGALVDECRRMNCRILPDPDGRLAQALGTVTSGDLVVYDSGGKLRYHGGITGSRGHEGDNLGGQTVLAILRGERSRRTATPVFGCPILEGTSRKEAP